MGEMEGVLHGKAIVLVGTTYGKLSLNRYYGEIEGKRS